MLADLRKKQAQREREAAEGKKKPSAGLGKIEVPEGWRWEAAKEVFLRPEVAKAKDVKVSFACAFRRGPSKESGEGKSRDASKTDAVPSFRFVLERAAHLESTGSTRTEGFYGAEVPVRVSFFLRSAL